MRVVRQREGVHTVVLGPRTKRTQTGGLSTPDDACDGVAAVIVS